MLGLALCLALASQTARAHQDDAPVPSGESACAFGAWLDGRGHGDVAVRSDPSEDAPVLGTLPVAPAGDTLYEYPVTVDLVAARDGWVKIAGASDDDNVQAGVPVRPVFRGEGWISSRVVRFGVQSGRGFAGPSADSDRLLDFPDRWLTEVATIERILACSGDWILLEAAITPAPRPNDRETPPNKRETVTRRAWFRGICSNPQTTCDQRSVDTGP